MTDKEEGTEGEVEGGGQKRKLIIGLVVVGLIMALAIPTILISRGQTDEPSELELLATKVTAQDVKIAAQAETIADLHQDIDNIPGEVECGCTDWTTAITKINADIAALQTELDAMDWTADVAGLQEQLDALAASWSRYALVTRLEAGYVDITIYGAGNYTVVLTLYGVGIESVQARYPLLYTVVAGFVLSDGAASFIIEPIAEWQTGDIIELKVTLGEAHYGAAVVGESSVASLPGW